jgi:hypothetical protein
LTLVVAFEIRNRLVIAVELLNHSKLPLWGFSIGVVIIILIGKPIRSEIIIFIGSIGSEVIVLTIGSEVIVLIIGSEVIVLIIGPEVIAIIAIGPEVVILKGGIQSDIKLFHLDLGCCAKRRKGIQLAS